MSMTILTILQFAGIFSAYSLMTVLFPAFVFRAWLRGKKLTEQFLISFLAGNFYLINIVLVLQLLHISNWWTLTLCTVVPAVVVWNRINGIGLKKRVSDTFQQMKRLSEGKVGLKTLCFRGLDRFVRALKWLAGEIDKVIVSRSVQWLWIAAVLTAVLWIYGRYLLLQYGYGASDIPVHMEWINDMSRGKVFSDGVYPFGFHCIIYYLHTVFRVDTYVLLRLFALVQNIYLHLVLLAFLKLCCKSRYLPYVGTLIYVLADWFSVHTYSRYFSSLPQEFGMLFILPAVYYAFAFFEERKNEVQAGDKKGRSSLFCLAWFTISISLTLAIHFYGTIIAGLFCVGIAVGYAGFLFRKAYFFRLMAAGLISVMMAVLPMGAAYLTGTPLQGSLRWGMSVIQGGDDEEKDTGEQETAQGTDDEQQQDSRQDGSTGNLTDTSAGTQKDLEDTGEKQTDPDEENIANDRKSTKVTGSGLKWKLHKLQRKASEISDTLAPVMRELLVANADAGSGYLLINAILLLLIEGSIFWILRIRCYGGMIWSTGIFMGIMALLLAAGNLGLPTLMDAARCSMYFAYLLPVAFVFCADAILYFVFYFQKLGWLRNLASLALSVCIFAGFLKNPQIKHAAFASDYVTNEAITCLTNIIHDEDDFTWTICSANDETQMGLDHGYHYEIITFLNKMENMGGNAKLTIPTKSVYFFIEKVPLDYAVAYEGSGQTISAAGAAMPLPDGEGLGVYQGESRWIAMSRMYYWAKEFQRLYPEDMKVYLETDKFVCYKITQNMYHLYNLAINYQYNMAENPVTEE